MNRRLAAAALSQLLTGVKACPLYAGVADDNIASIRALEKYGFAIVRREESFARARGHKIDEVVMKLE